MNVTTVLNETATSDRVSRCLIRRYFCPTKSVPVKLVVQFLYCSWFFLKKDGQKDHIVYQKTNITLYHGCTICCKVIVGPVEYPDPILEIDLFFSTTILTYTIN